MAALLLAYTKAFRIVAISPKRRSAARADKGVAALVLLFLLVENLLKALHQCLQTAQGFYQGFFFFCKLPLFEATLQPFGRDMRQKCRRNTVYIFEKISKKAVKKVEMLLMFDINGLAQGVEVLGAVGRQLLVQGLQQGQVLAGRYRQAITFEQVKEFYKHKQQGIIPFWVINLYF